MSVTSEEVRAFTRGLSARFDQGQSLVGMLTDLSARQANPELRQVIEQVNQEVQAGNPLSRAMAQHPRVFDQDYIATVRQGEVGGDLDQTLKSLF